MKNNQKLTAILEGLIIVILGILVAVVGVGEAIDIYFGILTTVTGSLIAIFVLYLIFSGKKAIPLGLTLISGALLAIGIGLFCNYLTFAMLVNILIMIVLGAGAALIVYGIHFAIRVNFVYGIGTIVIGAIAVTLCALYLNVPDFAKAFWVIVGILIAIYGCLLVVMNVIETKPSKK